MPRYKIAEETWWNETPITDVYEALDLLSSENSAREPIHLNAYDRDLKSWCIASPWYSEGSSGGDTWGTNYYQVDQSLVLALVLERFVEPLKEIGWGYTNYNKHKLVISEAGREKWRGKEKELLSEAESFLTLGVHTDLTGIPVRNGYGREHYRYGRFYVDFITPAGQTCRVFPEQKHIEYPYTFR